MLCRGQKFPKQVTSVFKELKIFTGNANPALTQEICSHLSVPLASATVKTFSDGEIMVEINENVRGRDVFVVQPTSQPANENLMELLVMIDALKRARAPRRTVKFAKTLPLD